MRRPTWLSTSAPTENLRSAAACVSSTTSPPLSGTKDSSPSADSEVLLGAMARALSRHEIFAAPARPHRLELRVDGGSASTGVRVLALEFRLSGPHGGVQTYRYEAVAGEVTARSLAAVIDAGIAAHAAEIERHILAAGAPLPETVPATSRGGVAAEAVLARSMPSE